MGIFRLLFIILPLIIFFVVLGIGVTLVRSILRFFGLGQTTSRTYGYDTSQDARRHSSQGSASSSSQSPSKNKKVIGDDEGEYVEFEEVR